MIQVALQIDHRIVRRDGMALQRMGDLAGPLRGKLEQPEAAVLQERRGQLLRCAAYGLSIGLRVGASHDVDDDLAFTEKSTPRLTELVHEALEITLEPL